VPARREVRAGAPLRVLSAACSSGEEPYSIAIALADVHAASIRAVDVNPAALRRAQAARYSSWSLRETPAELQRKWFRGQGRELVLDERIRAAVQFERKNLVDEDLELWQPESYDVVFCRNVLMYFAPEVARRVIGRIERALAPGGYLFLGHAETLRGLSHGFHLCHTHGTFYYQRREATPIAVPELARPEPEPAPELPELRAPRAAVAPLAGVLELLRDDRFSAALDALDAVAAGASPDRDRLLVRSAILAHGGRFAEAEAACRLVHAIDELDAGAHYVLALCRDGAGDRAAAVEHDQAAAYLDPMFAMPRLHLGLLARRAGDRDTASRELQQALLLLPHEETARLLLFGGGFTREALIALCRAELARVGGER
jgi:chemotaxis protein methyltransferase CheR